MSKLQGLSKTNKIIHMIIIPSISLYLLVSCSEDPVPEGRTHAKSCLLSAKMVLVVVFLKTVEVAAFWFWGIDMVKGVVAEVVHNVADLEGRPEEYREDRIIEFHYLANCEVTKREDHAINGRRKHESISKIGRVLRIIRKHVMYSMRKEVKIMRKATVRNIAIAVKDKPMQAILHQSKEDEPSNNSKDNLINVESLPALNLPKHIRDDNDGHKWDHMPSAMREGINPSSLKHLGWVSKQPVWWLHDMQIFFMIQLPDFCQECIIRVDESLDIFLVWANGHGVGHVEGERMVKLHLLLDVLEVVVFKEECTTGMMWREGSSVEDAILED